MDFGELMNLARQAREHAYAPYSNFKVGAALLCRNGKVYTGCNVENAAYSPTLCAERVAFGKAISEGEKDFLAIAVVGNTAPCTPCGVCRQVMAEFCGPDFVICTEGAEYTLKDLLPAGFSL